MPLELITIPCLSDNYAFLAHDATDGKTLLVDVPEAAPISRVLVEKGWTLSEILLTHHHQDHIFEIFIFQDFTTYGRDLSFLIGLI